MCNTRSTLEIEKREIIDIICPALGKGSAGGREAGKKALNGVSDPRQGEEVIMSTNLVQIGFGNMVAMNRVIGIEVPKSAPAKRTLVEARNKGLLITLTKGRKVRAAIFIDTGHIVLSALEPEAIAGRITDD